MNERKPCRLHTHASLSCFCRKEVSDHGIIPGDKCGMDFSEFAKNAHQLATLCNTEQCCPYIQQRKKWNPAFVDVHITDQSSCTFVPDGESIVDYIGTTETLNDDWKQVIDFCSVFSIAVLSSTSHAAVAYTDISASIFKSSNMKTLTYEMYRAHL